MDSPVCKVKSIPTVCSVDCGTFIFSISTASLVNNNLARTPNPPEAFPKLVAYPTHQLIQMRLPFPPHLFDRILNLLRPVSEILHLLPECLDFLRSSLELSHHTLASSLRYL